MARGGRVRVITTTYMGATEKRAVDELVRARRRGPGRVRRAHDEAPRQGVAARARLGLTTAFVGSSNLSHTALFDGLEWNVRLSSMDAAHVIDRVRMTFESHWASEHFEPYDPAVNGDAARATRSREHDRRSLGEASTISFANLDVRPYPHQQRMLEALDDRARASRPASQPRRRRDGHGQDRRRRARLPPAPRRAPAGPVTAVRRPPRGDPAAVAGDLPRGPARRIVRRDPRRRPDRRRAPRLRDGPVACTRSGSTRSRPDAFDVVVVDEFHHAAAATYDRLLNHLEPRELLGLTATPERLDGQDVTEWFDHRIAVELRLWEAIDQGFLVPFQYFGVADGTDLSQLHLAPRRLRAGGAQQPALRRRPARCEAPRGRSADRARPGLDARARLLRLQGARALHGAQVHARPACASIALTGDDSARDARRRASPTCGPGRLRCVFSVEVLGEGVDVPDVDCLLLLRPTASADGVRPAARPRPAPGRRRRAT